MRDSHAWGSIPCSNCKKGLGEQSRIILLIIGVLILSFGVTHMICIYIRTDVYVFIICTYTGSFVIGLVSDWDKVRFWEDLSSAKLWSASQGYKEIGRRLVWTP